ncbi:MAG: HD domain-containing protein [Desulfuromonadales bacterium]|nr:HD domain-containing protein [Desulfuromonadales bacterium]
MNSTFTVNLRLHDWVMYLCHITDLVSPKVAGHQTRTAYIASGIACEMGFSKEMCEQVLLAAAIHDIGALSVQERLACLTFEMLNPQHHAEAGYLLLKGFAPFATIARLVRAHHVPWSTIVDKRHADPTMRIASNIINLADRVEVSIVRDRPLKEQLFALCEKMSSVSGTRFAPEIVAAFVALSRQDSFSAELESESLAEILSARCAGVPFLLNAEELLKLATLLGRTIDFRSRFTAVHSNGVAAISAALAKLMGFSAEDVQLMKAAGLLHDVGKLSVPREVLEKPAALTREEFDVIRAHPANARRLFDNLPQLYALSDWVSYHHERLDGRGYPYALQGDEIPLGARIMSVADFFVALTEDRPYRAGLSTEEALRIVKSMVTQGALDADVVRYLELHFEHMNLLRSRVQNAARAAYVSFCTKLRHVDVVCAPAGDARVNYGA